MLTLGKSCYVGDMRQTKTMNVSLTPEMRAFVAERVASGRFQNASETVRAALRLLEEDERRRGAAKVPVGNEDSRRG